MALTDEARDMNTLAAFVGPRDVATLTRDNLDQALGVPQADVMVLFGGSILEGGDVLAQAMRNDVAGTYVIVGGAGHTTQTFRDKVRSLAPNLDFSDDAPEAEVFQAYLRLRHGLAADLLETRSTNCGNNISNLLELLSDNNVACESMILSQDATMQRRMHAQMERLAPQVTCVDYATYATTVVVGDGHLAYDAEPLGMWDIDRYRTLLMGEIPRLTDDEHGYGPRGMGFLAHVDIPASVTAAFERLSAEHPDCVRAANPAFAS